MTLKQKHTAGRSKRVKATKQLTPAEMFFYENAGYSYDPKTETQEQGRIRCAKEMAQDEQYARNVGFTFEWDYDQMPWDAGDTDYVPEEVLCCRIPDPANPKYSLASLGGIADPDSNYRRVIEAELAGEALSDYDKEIEILDAH